MPDLEQELREFIENITLAPWGGDDEAKGEGHAEIILDQDDLAMLRRVADALAAKQS